MKRRPALPAALIGGAVVAASAPAAPSDPPRFAWASGSQLPIGGRTYVWCGKWDDGTGVRTLRVQQSSPFAPPWWMLEVRVALGRGGHTIVFPALKGRTATMFAADPRQGLEASAESERSHGTISILDDISCRPGSHVRLGIRATLAGEEAGGRSIRISGTFVGTVGTKAAPGVQP
jgi:hypothetical protein